MNKILKHFSKTVDDYDTVADKVVFNNDELHENLIKAIPFEKDKEIHILDLGCGTGHGMKLAAKAFPNSTITGIDFSQKMINKSKEHLSEFKNRINLLLDDFNKLDFDQKYYAIISAIAIHNSSHEEKKALFRKIYGALETGGAFINGDFYQEETENLNLHLKRVYRCFLEKNLSGEELDTWIEHAFKEDAPMKLSHQFRILKEIGFKDIRLLWKHNNEALYIARK